LAEFLPTAHPILPTGFSWQASANWKTIQIMKLRFSWQCRQLAEPPTCQLTQVIVFSHYTTWCLLSGTPSPRRGLPWLKQSDNHPGVSIMTLDLGTQTGWALLSRDGSIMSGSECFKPQRFEGGGMRYLRFKCWLTEMKQCADSIDTVFMEEVRRHAGVDAAHAYGGFLATLTAWCEHHQIPYQGVPVGTIKKHATGKGNAAKEQMIAAVRELGHAPLDDNEADALALLHWALEHGGAR
jgi:Holliday junction resolvasome RuvABC endonuclease subunit